jgi:hypothetical protein
MRNHPRAIGGYFELEISNRGSLFHDSALALNTGRNALEHILKLNEVKHIYIPYFTCDVILEPLKKLKINYTFYSIDENFFPKINSIEASKHILYTNYFGLCQHNIELLLNLNYKPIIDNSQSFYDKPNNNVPTFYSARKFFGIPDGSFVYNSSCKLEDYPTDESIDRFQHLINRIDLSPEKGYLNYKENELKLSNQPIKKMSNLTKKILLNVDFENVRTKRNENFNFLHKRIKEQNLLSKFINSSIFKCPLIYPLLIENGEELREKLLSNKIYSPQYWPNVLNWVNKDTFEFYLTKNIVHLPIDQRYNIDDMKLIIDIINND